MRRKELIAYLIGAGVGGTILILPNLGSAVWKIKIPELREIYIPIFLLPIVWGLWNWLRTRLFGKIAIGIWGALLGFIIGLALFISLFFRGQLFPGSQLILFFVPAMYFLLWLLIVDPLNKALGVDG